MAKEFQTEKVLKLAWEQKTTCDHRNARAQQGYSYGCRESSVRGEGSVTLFFIFFCPLDSGVEAPLYLLHCQTALPSFHCHHDFIIAVPCASTTCHKGASCTGIEWS